MTTFCQGESKAKQSPNAMLLRSRRKDSLHSLSRKRTREGAKPMYRPPFWDCARGYRFDRLDSGMRMIAVVRVSSRLPVPFCSNSWLVSSSLWSILLFARVLLSAFLALSRFSIILPELGIRREFRRRSGEVKMCCSKSLNDGHTYKN